MNERTEMDDINRTIQAFAVAWSSNDPKVAASFFAEDAVRVDAAGVIQHGRAEIEAVLEARFRAAAASPPTIAFEPETNRMLTAELALWRGAMKITSANEAAPSLGNVVLLMQKQGTRWLILEAHPKMYRAPRPVASTPPSPP